jgi:6-phosphogluconolactonase
MGRTPRCIGLDPTGRFLYGVNEQGDTIVALRVDQSAGTLTPASQVAENASSVTIVFASGA